MSEQGIDFLVGRDTFETKFWVRPFNDQAADFLEKLNPYSDYDGPALLVSLPEIEELLEVVWECGFSLDTDFESDIDYGLPTN